MNCEFTEGEENPPSTEEDEEEDRLRDATNNTERHPDGHPNRDPDGQNIPEDMSNQSTSSGTADVEEMTLELSDGEVKVESEALTSLADSTMKDGLGSVDASESVEIRCCIERVKVGHSSTCPSDPFRDLEHDSKVIIPSETTIGDLVQTVLRCLHYSEMDLLGARGMIVIKNWKPMTLEAITDDPLVKVGDLLAGLSTLVTLKIHLRCFSKFRQIDDVKDKLLCFLLRNSQELLQASGCPIVQTAFEEILDDKSNFPEDLRNQFNDWYKDQVNCRRIRPIGAQSITNSPSPIREEPQKSEGTENVLSVTGAPSGRATTLPAAKALGRLWLDHDGERVRLKHRRKEGTSLRRDELHPARFQTEFPNDNRENRFNPVDVLTTSHQHTSLDSNTVHRRGMDSIGPHPASTTLKDEREADAKEESSPGSDDDEERVPELPNRNAVYVIRPLPISSSGSDSMEVIIADSDSDSNDPPLTPEPQDLSKTVSSSTAAADNIRKDHIRSGEKTLMEKPTVEHFPTNLSLRDVVSKSLPKVPRDEKHSTKKPGDALDQIKSKRSNIFTSESPRKLKNSRYDDYSGDMHIHNSEHRRSPKLPQNLPSAFGLMPQTLHHHHQQHNHHQHAASHLLALSHTMNFMRHLHGPPLPIHQPFQDYINDTIGGSDSDQKKRSRVFIDPISETPKLEEWFAVDSHPSTATIEELTNELNRSIYRERFPKLEPKNVQLWFKNHRAKVKRLKSEPTTNGRV